MKFLGNTKPLSQIMAVTLISQMKVYNKSLPREDIIMLYNNVVALKLTMYQIGEFYMCVHKKGCYTFPVNDL